MYNASKTVVKRAAVVIILMWGIFAVWNYFNMTYPMRKELVGITNIVDEFKIKEKPNTNDSESSSLKNIEMSILNITRRRPKGHSNSNATFSNSRHYITNNNNTYEHLLNPGFPLEGSTKHPEPGFILGNLQSNSDIIIGIPTVKRSKGDYLMNTITSLLNNRNNRNTNVKILVYIGETSETYLNERANQIFEAFKDEIEQGDLQVIAPPENYYPNWDTSITTSLGDRLDRVKWRSKQNLDQVFLMVYLYNLSPKYYLMLEDDVLTKEGFDDTILHEAKARESEEWFYISFSHLGAIGKLFRTTTLPSLASYIHMFWNKQPLDWLLDDYVRNSNCGHGDWNDCLKKMHPKMINYKPSLFQHMGMFSSLKDKLMPVKDKNFK